MMDSLYEERTPENMKLLKRNMTLDFNSPTSNSKKVKLMKTCILESPDLKMLKLASPELERMIIAQNGLVTTTPTPSGILPHYFLKQESEVTEEQEQFSRGFVDALNQLHQTNGYNERQHQNHNQNNNSLNNHNNNSHQNNNNNSHHQNNQTINTISNNINSHSSDSSSDLTIAEHNTSNSCNNSNNNISCNSNRLNNSNNSRYINTSNSSNNFSTLIPSAVVTTAVTSYNGNKFVVPSVPPQEQYVNISQTNGGEVIINNTSVLPSYSTAVNNNSIYPMTIKVESQKQSNPQPMPITTSSARGLTPPLSPQQHLAPIDMADQERIKLERKRLRNRIAASKCRRRKLERISRLEDKVKGLKGENSELSVVVNKLRDQVCSLKQQVMNHVKCGCQLMVPQ